MNLFILFLGQLLLLFILSDKIGKLLFRFLFRLFKNKNAAVGILTFLFLPGTIIHELAHLIVAEVLRVPTGKISFTPQVEHLSHHDEIQAGSVEIGKTDPLRRLLIGTAPMFFGVFFLFLLTFVFNRFWPDIIDIKARIAFGTLIGFLLFAVSNNMFSSRKDMEGAWVLLPFFGLIFALLYISGIRFTLTEQTLTIILSLLQTLTTSLTWVLVINGLLFILGSIIERGLSRR